MGRYEEIHDRDFIWFVTRLKDNVTGIEVSGQGATREAANEDAWYLMRQAHIHLEIQEEIDRKNRANEVFEKEFWSSGNKTLEEIAEKPLEFERNMDWGSSDREVKTKTKKSSSNKGGCFLSMIGALILAGVIYGIYSAIPKFEKTKPDGAKVVYELFIDEKARVISLRPLDLSKFHSKKDWEDYLVKQEFFNKFKRVGYKDKNYKQVDGMFIEEKEANPFFYRHGRYEIIKSSPRKGLFYDFKSPKTP